METSVTIIANGKAHTVPRGQRLPAFLEGEALPLERVVVEYNGQALTRTEAREVALDEGDRLEIVRVVAGG
jgi:thiamine biosynthesis protein ThiS